MSTARNILVADDEVINLDILSHSLEKNGYNVVCCQNGVEALAELDNQPDFFDIVLLDRMMPELDGIELLLKIKKDTRLKDIPVIMQSAKSLAEEVQEGLNSGAVEYLTKPYNTKDLLSALDIVGSEEKSANTTNVEPALDVIDFEICDPDDIMLTSLYISVLYPESEKIQSELTELIRISIEHGNLSIPIPLRDKLLRMHKEKEYNNEVANRLTNAIYIKNKTAINLTKFSNQIILKIKNDGVIVNWKTFFEVESNDGDNILIFRNDIFDVMEYNKITKELTLTYLL